MELVSVIIPSYFGKDLLKMYSLKSVLTQTHSNLEILIINDGPDNDTKKYLEELNDPRVIYEEIERDNYNGNTWAIGGARSRNYALDIAKGAYICPIDQDDFWNKTYVEEKLKNIKKCKCEFMYGRALNVGNNKVVNILGSPFPKNPFLNGSNTIPHLSVIYEASLTKLKYPETGKIAGDYVLWKEMYKKNVNMKFLNIIDSIRNGKNNSYEGLCKIYEQYFGGKF